jgi:predicted metalloprotease with PDZ domain
MHPAIFFINDKLMNSMPFSRTVRRTITAFIFCLAIGGPVSAQPGNVHYTLSMPNPSDHVFVVTVRIGNLPPGETAIELILPVWRPGRYTVFNFAGDILEFSASGADGAPLPWSKTDKTTWKIETRGGSEINARYRIFAEEFYLRTKGLDETHGFVDGSSVFMYAEQFRFLPVSLEVIPYDGWHVTTGLEGTGNRFTAPGYDYFIDCPLEIGTQQDFEFEVDGVPHVLSMYGEGDWTADTLIRDISKIVKSSSEFWGDMPYERYVFQVHVAPWAGGATEHMNSTIIGARPNQFSSKRGYDGFLATVAHEFIHTWNVKRLRPKGISPYDYKKENYVRELWIAEGMTSYLEDIIRLRAGLRKAEDFTRGLASVVRGDRSRPGNRVQSLSAASFDAWIKFDRRSSNGYNTETSFYGKGSHVSLLLDLTIRKMTGNGKSLEDVMRAMYRKFPLAGPGYTVDDLALVAGEIAGGDLGSFFDNYVHGTEPLPWEETLLIAGLELGEKDTTARPWIGLSTRDAGERTTVTTVVDGSPARAAGLDYGDEIVAMNGKKVRSSDVTTLVSGLAAGDSVTVTAFRADRLREFTILLGDSPVPEYSVVKVAEPSPVQKEVYESWLSTTWE